MARAVEAVAAVWRRLAEAIREAAAVLGERVRAVVEAWGLVEERARRGGPPERVNCRCAVVRVERPVVPDAVRAGRGGPVFRMRRLAFSSALTYLRNNTHEN